MTEQEAIDRVQAIYGTFGDGDGQALIDALSEDVVWQDHTPWAVERKGRAGLAEFFAGQLEAVRFISSVPHEFVAQNNTVVVIGHDVVRVA